MRVRGLKHGKAVASFADEASHPVRVRGLKQDMTWGVDAVQRRTPCGCVD